GAVREPPLVSSASTSRTIRSTSDRLNELLPFLSMSIFDSHHAPPHRRRVASEQAASRLAVAAQHHSLSSSSAQRIDCKHRLAIGRLAVDAVKLHDEQLPSFQRRMFDSRRRRSHYGAYLHASNLNRLAGCQSRYLPKI